MKLLTNTHVDANHALCNVYKYVHQENVLIDLPKEVFVLKVLWLTNVFLYKQV